MNYGLYLSAAGMTTNLYRQDVIANNLANVDTAGFKKSLVSFNERKPESEENMLGADAVNELLDRLGGGVLAHQTRLDMSGGALERTGNALDAAIQGDGFFVYGVEDSSGKITQQLGRDGRWTVGSDGRLMTTAGGHTVLGMDGQPIELTGSGAVTIDETGRMRQGGEEVGRIRVVEVSDTSEMKPMGGGMYEVPASLMKESETAQVQQGFVERSNVDPVSAMVEMIEATRAIDYNAKMFRYTDAIMEQATTTLGRIA